MTKKTSLWLVLALIVLTLGRVHSSATEGQRGGREGGEREDTCSSSNKYNDMTLHRRALLTSNGFSNEAIRTEFRRVLKLRQPNIAKARVLYIPDALVAEGQPYAYALDEFKHSLSRDFNITLVSGLQLSEATKEAFEEELQNTDCIYFECGNTFYLHYHMARHLDLIRKSLDDGVVYVGSSAGSICAGKTISIALWKGWDDPSVVPKVDYESLEVLPGKSFFPHYSSQWKTLVDKESRKLTHEVITLTDHQCYSADEMGERLIG